MPSARSQRHMVYLVSVPWRKHTRENEKMRMWLVCYCYMSCKSFHQRVVLHYPEEIYSFANFIVMKWIFYSGINEIGGCESLCLTLALSSSSFRCSRLWEFCFVLTVALDDGILNNNWSNQKMTWHIQEHVNTRLRTQKVWRERTRKRESEGGIRQDRKRLTCITWCWLQWNGCRTMWWYFEIEWKRISTKFLY